MERREEIRNASGQLLFVLKETQDGTFCETKNGKRTPTITLAVLKKRIDSFEKIAN